MSCGEKRHWMDRGIIEWRTVGNTEVAVVEVCSFLDPEAYNLEEYYSALSYGTKAGVQ